MSERLTNIASEIALLLQGIQVANGDPFDFGTINRPDQGSLVYPTADITYQQEQPRSDTQSALGFDECTFAIKIVAFNPSPNPGDPAQPTPVHAIDTIYDDILAAIKKRVRYNNGYLPLTGSATMLYQGFTKNVEHSGDQHRPDSMTVRIKVHYQSTDPARDPAPLQEAF